MSNQDNKGQLNPSAREFVPNFGGGSSGASPASTLNSQLLEQQQQSQFEPVQEQQYQHQHQQQQRNTYQQSNYNNNYNSKPHYNGGGGRGRGGGGGGGGRNYNNSYNNGGGHRSSGGSNNHFDNYRPHYSNDPNVDPMEMEARCEAVIEILQDDKIRNVINPNYDHQDSNPGSVGNGEESSNISHHQFDDEEDLYEMMAMQEECRLEMMKFYIQSQNPGLFENVYHGVSYTEGQMAANAAANAANAHSAPATHHTTTPSHSSHSSSASLATPTPSAPVLSVKDQIINDLNVNSPEFDPTTLLLTNLSLNDK